MSGEPEIARTPEEDDTEEEEIKSSYKPPPEKTIEEILSADQEDESLRKYKEALLGQAQTGPVIVGKLIKWPYGGSLYSIYPCFALLEIEI